MAVVAGVPLTIAALHPGFPVSDVDLNSQDVWVTNGEQLMGGRLNRQIDELNGSVVASSPDFEVLQDGDTLYMYDPVVGRVESVDPATTQVTSAVDVPLGSEVSYGGTTIAIMSPEGSLWAIPAVGDLQFNYVSMPPLAELGKDAHATVTSSGAIVAVSAENKKIIRVETLADLPVESDFVDVGTFQLAAVGESAVVFDQSTNEIVTESGSRHSLDGDGLRLQQNGPESSFAVVATADSLLKVDLGSGSIETVSADIGDGSSPATARDVAAPVYLDGCAHGAWANAQRYVLSCDGAEPEVADIAQPTQGSRMEFRVNRSVIALNDLDTGNVWLVDENMRLVENWEDVTPPEEQETEEVGDEKSAIQSFEDTLAERTETNRPPTANDDDYGIRPGRTTILSLLDNDTDPDGDVLVISAWDRIAETTGRLDPIDGSRALQFTPAPGFVGSVSFSYTVDDGRQGTASARVTARVVDDESNASPVEVRRGGVSVEANQTVSYNVLADWRDPDGDDLYLIGASPKSGDLVRFTPDGFVTFSHQTSELGEKEVVFLVTDGRGEPVQGTLTVKVEPPGSLNPIGTPDFASTFTGDMVVVEPLLNDLSPSGAQLSLVAIEEPAKGQASVSFSADSGTVSFQSTNPGVFYVTYTLAAGGNQSVGIIRFDVQAQPADDELAPVAVKDTAYLRGEEPTTVSVLSNDVSPSGRVLAVQSIAVPTEYSTKGLVVELLESTLIRVTSPAALTSQVSFTYTISDGVRTATAGVTVVPVPALTKHQPPVAQNDSMRVRVGDIATLDVLDNDFHPDDSPMFLDEALVTPPSEGIAFISKDTLRFQAPRTAGQYTVDYRVLDPFGETATATATFTVVPEDEANNQDPEPMPIVARVLAGGTIRVNIPLNGIDPDGDSTQLLNFPTNPALGSVVDRGPDFFFYEASPAGAGTDVFSYEVYDAFGATGVGEIKIAVIPEPDELLSPTAVPDSVSIRPGRIAQVDLTLNDSDPQGAPISVSEQLIDVPEGVEASVVGGRYLMVTAPNEEQSFTLRYELTNDRGGRAVSYVLVQVTPEAPLLAPQADDVPILTKEIAGKETITIDVLDGFAFNPAGSNDDLVVGVEGPNADAAELLEDGTITVTPGEKRMAIAYRVTNEVDELSAMAFILVPAAVDEGFDDPPYIDPNLPVQYVSMNETREWNLSDIVKVPSGRDAWIVDPDSVTGVQSNGQKIYVDKDTLRFTPVTDYRGPAAINFTVTDGASKNDPKGITASLTLNIVVGDPEFRDTPPEFTSPTVQVEVGEQTVTDLRAATGHPNPQILQEVTYSNISGATTGVTANLSGSELTVSAPRNAPKGTTMTLNVTLRWDKFEVPGTINVVVVGSTRPHAVAVTDVHEMKRGGGDGGGSITIQPLVNDSNPYQTTGEPLTIVDAVVSNTGEPAGVYVSGSSVRITPSASLKSGVIEVIYTIEDATQDKDRRANGTIRLTVSDVPDQVAKPTRSSDVGGDRQATFRFTAPATNGKPITGYDVQVSPSAGVTVPTNCQPGADCTLTGLTNGTAYTIMVRAINEHGPGAWSVSSDPVIPYGTPGTPVPEGSSSGWAPASATWTWPEVNANGGSTTYAWRTSTGVSGTGRSATISGLAAGSYTITVTATNTGGKSSPAGTASVTVESQTVPGAVTVSGNVTDSQAPGAISWSWSQPSNASQGGRVTDNLQYRWQLNGGAWSSWSASRSTSNSGLSQGSYSLTVQARNNAGESATAASPGYTINNPPPPPSSVKLYRGPMGTVAGCSNCHSIAAVLTNLPDGNYPVKIYTSPDNSSWNLGWTYSSVNASGGFLNTYARISNTPYAADAYVLIDVGGYQSSGKWVDTPIR